MNVLVVGSGGREHALVWALRRSPSVDHITCAPGNPGIGTIADCVPIPANDSHALLAFVLEHRIDLTVVGPEQPLADDIASLFEQNGAVLFGPTRKAAELEWSKTFAKEFMQRHAIPTAGFRLFTHAEREEAERYLRATVYPLVIKADGLAAGKGVVICRESGEALRSLDEMLSGARFGEAGRRVVVEEFMEGEEASVFALTDGSDYVLLAPAQDHKRVFDGDRGKNTGGMGAYAPAPVITRELMRRVESEILQPTLRGMQAEGRTYRGCLYIGLMCKPDGPRVVEYNCRFGDPETQVVLPLFPGDLAAVLLAAARGGIGAFAGSGWQASDPSTAACVIMASEGYPDSYPTGRPIHGLDRAGALDGVMVFHAGTRNDGAGVVTAGGRVLAVTAVQRRGGLAATLRQCYEAIGRIAFEGAHYRRDIGHQALAREHQPRNGQS
jgi:phosphoribosylamine--glycine ligase